MFKVKQLYLVMTNPIGSFFYNSQKNYFPMAIPQEFVEKISNIHIRTPRVCVCLKLNRLPLYILIFISNICIPLNEYPENSSQVCIYVSYFSPTLGVQKISSLVFFCSQTRPSFCVLLLLLSLHVFSTIGGPTFPLYPLLLQW